MKGSQLFFCGVTALLAPLGSTVAYYYIFKPQDNDELQSQVGRRSHTPSSAPARRSHSSIRVHAICVVLLFLTLEYIGRNA